MSAFQTYFYHNYILVFLTLGMFVIMSVKSGVEEGRKIGLRVLTVLILILSILEHCFAVYIPDCGSPALATALYALYGILRPAAAATFIYAVRGLNANRRRIWIPALLNAMYYVWMEIGGLLARASADGITPSRLEHGYIITEWVYWIYFMLVMETLVVRERDLHDKRMIFLLVTGLMCAEILQETGILAGCYTLMLALCSVFYYLTYHVLKARKDATEKDDVLKEQRASLMVSQIQPHFVYNTLNTITALCQIDPDLAGETTIKFSQYLRLNMMNMGKSDVQPFKKELEHTNIYLDIEKLRFGDRINVHYDIEEEDFLLPAITLQPLVENAVKHGICKRIEGGNITIRSYKRGRDYIVEVEDDGVGFEYESIYNDGKEHIGIKNVRQRLRDLVYAELVIDSMVGVGTKATIVVSGIDNKIEKEEGSYISEVFGIGR